MYIRNVNTYSFTYIPLHTYVLSVGCDKLTAWFYFFIDVPSKVPVISVINQSISNDGDKVTLTLNWDEPFDNFNPVLSYTVSCIGNSSCPPSVTVYNDTSIYLSNLMLQTMYTFSVIATNSIGDGEAGVLSIITASSKLCNYLYS